MTLPPSSSLLQLRPKAPLQEAVVQAQAGLPLPTNLHTSLVVLVQDRNYQANEAPRTSISSLEMKRLQQELGQDTEYTTLSDMGRWRIGTTWRDSGRIPSSNICGWSLKTTTFFLRNLYVFIPAGALS